MVIKIIFVVKLVLLQEMDRGKAKRLVRQKDASFEMEEEIEMEVEVEIEMQEGVAVTTTTEIVEIEVEVSSYCKAPLPGR